MDNDVVCGGEMLYACSYGGSIDDTVYVKKIATVTKAWLENVRYHGHAVCSESDTVWLDFAITGEDVLGETWTGENEHLRFMRRFVYRRYCEQIASFFGMDHVYVFLHKVMDRRFTADDMDRYDRMYCDFFDAMLSDVRFNVCMKRNTPAGDDGGEDAATPVTGGGGGQEAESTVRIATEDGRVYDVYEDPESTDPYEKFYLVADEDGGTDDVVGERRDGSLSETAQRERDYQAIIDSTVVAGQLDPKNVTPRPPVGMSGSTAPGVVRWLHEDEPAAMDTGSALNEDDDDEVAAAAAAVVVSSNLDLPNAIFENDETPYRGPPYDEQQTFQPVAVSSTRPAMWDESAVITGNSRYLIIEYDVEAIDDGGKVRMTALAVQRVQNDKRGGHNGGESAVVNVGVLSSLLSRYTGASSSIDTSVERLDLGQWYVRNAWSRVPPRLYLVFGQHEE